MNEIDSEDRKRSPTNSPWLDKIIKEEFEPQWKETFEKLVLKLFPDINEYPGMKRGLWDSYRNGGLHGTVTTVKYLRERYDFVEKTKNEPEPAPLVTTKAN